VTNFSAIPQAAVLVVLEEGSASRTTATAQANVLAVLDQTITAENTRTTEANLLVVLEDTDGITRTPQANLLYVYNEGARENNLLRAWSFILDGHSFYVLHLGMLGTWVCDVSSGYQWSQWITEGSESWNAEQGCMWQDRIVAGDNQNPLLWLVDPEAENDEDGTKPVSRVATALIPARGRDTVTLGMLSVNASAGAPSYTGATLGLRFSDDNGNTWVAMPAVDLGTGEFDQNLQFGSLGTFGQPGRIIEVSDSGGLMRLSDVNVELSTGKYKGG
jgi:hypothetical protein